MVLKWIRHLWSKPVARRPIAAVFCQAFVLRPCDDFWWLLVVLPLCLKDSKPTACSFMRTSVRCSFCLGCMHTLSPGDVIVHVCRYGCKGVILWNDCTLSQAHVYAHVSPIFAALLSKPACVQFFWIAPTTTFNQPLQTQSACWRAPFHLYVEMAKCGHVESRRWAVSGENLSTPPKGGAHYTTTSNNKKYFEHGRWLMGTSHK